MPLIQTLELAAGKAETDTETRGCPFGQISVNGRESEHIELVPDFPVIFTIVKLRAETEIQLPVVPETVGEHRLLLNDGRGDDLTGLSRGLFHDGDVVLVLGLVNLDTLSEDGGRRDERGRSNQKK